MRRFVIPIAILIGIYMDSIFFNMVNISGVRPDVLLAIIASLGVLGGSRKAGIIGLCVGLFMDVFFNKYVGLTAISYMLTGVVGGFFFQKFYADNLVIPSAVAGAMAFVKDNIMALSHTIGGVNYDYLNIMLAYILPCALFTAAVCIPIHIILKRATARQVRVEHRSAKAGHQHNGGI